MKSCRIQTFKKVMDGRWLSTAIAATLLLLAVPEMAATEGNPMHEQSGFTATRGGDGGQIIRVTTLDRSGPGSLREAIESEGPRIIVFEVGGVIDLDKTRLIIDEPYVTIAGQTAPSPGITVIRGDILITTHDVIVRHLRVRLGDDVQGGQMPSQPDTMGTLGPNAHDIIIDHCSISWGIDENMGASGPRLDGPDGTSRRVTFSNNIVAESLRDSFHSGGLRAMGMLIHDWAQDIAIIGNLFAHNYHRNPLLKANTTGVLVNNVIYNPGKEAIHLAKVDDQFPPGQPPKSPVVSVVGNILLYGADTRADLPLVYNHRNTFSSVYLSDNAAYKRNGDAAPITNEGVNVLAEKPLWPAGLEALGSGDLLEYTLKNVGARPWDRDEADRRVIDHVRNRTGRIIDSQNDVGGYPSPEKTTRKLDVPDENIQQWLESFVER
jgi:pectate lyase